MNIKFASDSSSLMQVNIGDGKKAILSAGQRGMLTFRIDKKMMNFEDYPNDV